MYRLLFSAFCFLLPLLSWAGVDLYLWRPPGHEFAMVIPAREGESAGAAAERYVSALERNPELRKYAEPLRNASGGSFERFHSGREVTALAVANDVPDFMPEQRRMRLVLGPLKARGARTAMIPVAAAAGLSPGDAEEFRRLIVRETDLLISVGGDDIHPSLYGEAITHARNLNLSRDREELRLVRNYLDDGKGFFFGICRGHQMGGVAAGCSLVQDLEKELGEHHPSGITHELKAREPGALTKEIFGGAEKIEVNSRHHQMVKVPRGNANVRITAVTENARPIAEISEYSGRRGISVQFHPEDMTESPIHERVYNLLYREAKQARDGRLVRARSLVLPVGCSHAFKKL